MNEEELGGLLEDLAAAEYRLVDLESADRGQIADLDAHLTTLRTVRERVQHLRREVAEAERYLNLLWEGAEHGEGK